MFKDFRSLCLWCALWLVTGTSMASAQWMFEKRPTVKGSSFEVAQSIPAHAQAVVGFHFKGQLDVLGLVSDFKEAAAEVKDGSLPDDIADVEKQLGQPLEQWIAMFNGSGYFALLEPRAGGDWSESLVFALQLDKPEAFAKWLEPKLGQAVKEREVGGFRVREIRDGTRFGLGKGWFFVCASDAAAEGLSVALSGKGSTLASLPLFLRAQNSLTGGASGMFAYAEGDGLRRTMYGALELSADYPGAKEFGFWDFAVLSVDLAQEQGDAFLGFNPDAGPLVAALRKPGQVKAELLDLLPAGQSTLNAGDAAWLAGTVDTLADEIPALGMVVAMAHMALNEYGDFGEAFSGTLVVGTNLPDYLAEQMRLEMYFDREADQLIQCKSNLKNIGTALEMWSTDNSGAYPKSMEVLAPDYLRTLLVCPTQGAKPYRYELIKVEGSDQPAYLVTCTGHQHKAWQADHPKYSGVEGLIEGEARQVADPNKPEPDPVLAEPSLSVMIPVKSVPESHNLMLAAVEANRSKPAQECGSNLQSIGSGCDMYATDHEGAYPEKLSELTEGYYLYEVPSCPAAGKDTYSESYKVVKDDSGAVGISVFCQGHNHPELEADKPLYDTPEGLVMGPIAEASEPIPAAPVNGAKQSYEVKDGPKAVLDSGANLLRLGYGPKADQLLAAPGGRWSEKPSIAEALRWGADSVVYLDYLDLEPMYAGFQKSLTQAAEQGEGEAIFLRALTNRLRPRVGPLQGVSCLKVTDQGLHYRSKGGASTGQFMAGTLLGMGFYIPNAMQAQGQGKLTACKSNLKNIGTGLEMWSTDNEGKYPDSLDKLTPDYLRQIPECPAAGTDTYSDTYTVSKREGVDYDVYELYCKGNHHEDVHVEQDYPRYNGFEGLVERP